MQESLWSHITGSVLKLFISIKQHLFLKNKPGWIDFLKRNYWNTLSGPQALLNGSNVLLSVIVFLWILSVTDRWEGREAHVTFLTLESKNVCMWTKSSRCISQWRLGFMILKKRLVIWIPDHLKNCSVKTSQTLGYLLGILVFFKKFNFSVF